MYTWTFALGFCEERFAMATARPNFAQDSSGDVVRIRRRRYLSFFSFAHGIVAAFFL